MIKMVSYYIVLLIVGFIIALVISSKKTERLNEGSTMPVLCYQKNKGEKVIERDPTKMTVIIWFHPNCKHCLYQLDLLNENLSSFYHAQFFFFTDDLIFPEDRCLGKWPNLTSADNVRFGIIDKPTFEDHFGSVVMPSVFIFDRSGKLTNKTFGEVKIEKLLELINTTIVPEHEKAVLNNTSNRG